MSPWNKEIWRLIWLTGLALIIGFISGYTLACLLITSIGYIIWHFNNIKRLERWLNKPSKTNPLVSWLRPFFCIGKNIWKNSKADHILN